LQTLLIIEDDPAIMLGLRKNLSYEGYRVVTAADGDKGLEMAFDAKPDLILLDLMLPGINGFEICRTVRRHDPTVPILIISAKDQEIDKIMGFELGADDYITKPFSVKEVVARVKAALRRSTALEQETEILHFGPNEVDFQGRSLRIEGREIDVSPREFDLLQYLSRNPNRVLSRDQILNRVWGYDYYGTARTIDNFVQKLRRKVEVDPEDPQYIVTVRGVGYKFVLESRRE
jgi:two-component system, OmpR family, alkaline phosphatase synthesis response regulator PhoP